VTEELTKKAAEMLLQGATLLSEPCPYCAGVRVMKKGQALCISCGRQPEKKEISNENKPNEISPIEKTFEKKLENLSKELEQEKDHEKQQNILKTINSLLETMEKMKGKQ
jgi:UPF0148 protein